LFLTLFTAKSILLAFRPKRFWPAEGYLSTDDEFTQLWSRLSRGEESAANELLNRYEQEIRRFIRFRLSDPSLRRVVDSLDICQSVFGRFFVQLSTGAIELDNPQQLRALLFAMARNRLYDEVRREHAVRRDSRRAQSDEAALDSLADKADSPSQLVAADELLQMVRRQLSAEDQYLIDQKLSGRPWAELANELGGNAEAIRKRATRALDRAVQTLGLVEECDATN
jgi:RNA polymerase sigma factor (sigma-70 family)